MKSLIRKNARMVTPTGIFPGDLRVENRRIAALSFEQPLPSSADRTLDLDGLYLAPGFIDIHTHGAGGFDFMDGGLEAVYGAGRAHLAHGTTSIVPTSITGSRESLFDLVDLFNQAELEKEGVPTILGLHLEGPYFAPAQSGAQDPRHMRPPRPDEYLEVLARTKRIVRWSFAVELEGAAEFLRVLRGHGVVSSLAHSDATCAEVRRAYDNGLAALTHFYSAMSGVARKNGYRVAGAVEAGYLIDDLFVEVIADGRHLPAELLQLVHKVKGADRICLVTDSMRAAGMPEGRYKLGHPVTGTDCFVEDGVAKMPDRQAFAGSVATADRLVRTMRDLGGAPLFEAVRMMTLTPAKLLRIDDRKGSIAVGKDADLVAFDEGVNVRHVVLRGEILN